MTRPTILLLHGIGANGHSGFFPLLKDTFSKDSEIIAPDLPNTATPQCNEWVQATEDLVTGKEITITIAHSLGGTLAMNMISQGKLNTNTLMTIGSSHGPKDDKDMDTFLVPRIDISALKALEHFYAVTSYDDPATHADYSALLVKQAGATGIFFDKWGHFLENKLPHLLMSMITQSIS